MLRRLSKFLKVFIFFSDSGIWTGSKPVALYICKYVPISFSSRLQLIVLDFFQLLRILLHSNICLRILCFPLL